MKTQAPPSGSAAAAEPSLWRPAATGGDRLWFTRADPTTRALIRILTGLVATYTLLAYSFDLQAFFGTNAWLDLEVRREFRDNSPQVATPWGWQLEAPPPPQTQFEAEYVKHYQERWGMLPPG